MEPYREIRSTAAGLQTAAEGISRAPIDDASWRFSANGIAELASIVEQMADRLERMEGQIARIESSAE